MPFQQQAFGMDDNRGGRQATAEEHEIELVNQQSLLTMSDDIEAALKCLNKSARGSRFTIFRVPEVIGEGIAKACRPRIVSIGPYHHGKSGLEMLQGYKWRYLHNMLGRTQPDGISLKNLIDVVALKEKMIRQCYSERTDNFSELDLVKMMVLDGCFIIEFLHQLAGVIRMDPPLNNSYVLYSVARDLLRLENQVPYFVLEDLFETTNVPEATWSLANLASNFFRCLDVGRGYVLERHINIKGVHLLDSFRLSLIPQGQQDNSVGKSFYLIPHGQQDNPVKKSSYRPSTRSASILRRVGIRFEKGQARTFLEIKFDSKRRTVRIPQIAINDDLNFILPNMVAFEQCRGQKDRHITTYAIFMTYLIGTADDVQLLRDRAVILNDGMSNQDVARFFDDICKDANIEIHETYLVSCFSLFNELSKHSEPFVCSALLLSYFHDNLWSILSGLAVVVTLVGIIQTVYAVLQYYHPK